MYSCTFWFLEKTDLRKIHICGTVQCTLDLVTHLVCQKTVTKSRGVTKYEVHRNTYRVSKPSKILDYGISVFIP